MQYFPIFVDTKELHCLIVGAGEVAARKAELLLKTSATVTLVAPWACDTILRLAAEEKVILVTRDYQPNDLQAKRLVFVATNDSLLNAQIHQQAKALNILVNVVDNAPLCEFITPSIVDRSLRKRGSLLGWCRPRRSRFTDFSCSAPNAKSRCGRLR